MLLTYVYLNLIPDSSIPIQLFWGRLDDLFFLTINTLISCNVPGIVQTLQSVLLNLIQMDFLMTDLWLPQQFYQKGVDLEDIEPLNVYF
jgi:hypothetical protein